MVCKIFIQNASVVSFCNQSKNKYYLFVLSMLSVLESHVTTQKTEEERKLRIFYKPWLQIYAKKHRSVRDKILLQQNHYYKVWVSILYPTLIPFVDVNIINSIIRIKNWLPYTLMKYGAKENEIQKLK